MGFNKTKTFPYPLCQKRNSTIPIKCGIFNAFLKTDLTKGIRLKKKKEKDLAKQA